MNRQNMSKHLDWVDGLKGVSAIIVVLQHILVTIFGYLYLQIFAFLSFIIYGMAILLYLFSSY